MEVRGDTIICKICTYLGNSPLEIKYHNLVKQTDLT